MTDILLARIEESAEFLRNRLPSIPQVLLVAGSGLSSFARSLVDPMTVGYEEIPHFPMSTVAGHVGNLVWGRVGGSDGPPVLVMNGRVHLYEGHDARTATLPLRAILRAGIQVVILSNAAGGLNRQWAAGDIMVIADHINFQFRNPLIGPNLDALGPRFPDMSACWDPRLRRLAHEVARECGITLREGVYLGGTGPSYETQAEVQMMRQWADVVGMSTVLENLVAVHAGVRCLGLSVITNSLVHRTDVVTTHEEVIETGRRTAATFERLVGGILRNLARENAA